MYKVSEPLQAMGEAMIREAFPGLAECNIAYLISDKEKNSKGRTVYADVKKVPDMWRAITGLDFVITYYLDAFAEDVSNEARRVLMKHELMHIIFAPDTDGIEGERATRGHDVEDFGAIIEEYGYDWIHTVQ